MNRVEYQVICLALGAFTFSTLGFTKTGSSTSVQYHLKKKSPASKKTSPEIYSALETDDGNPISTHANEEPRKIAPAPKVAQTAAPTRQPASPSTPPSKDYDVVPEQLNSPLVRRLQLVQILIQKYSRAYDYRSHTTAELEKILADLNSRQMQSALTQQISMAPQEETSPATSGDAEKSSDPLFSGNSEEESALETLPDMPPPNPA